MQILSTNRHIKSRQHGFTIIELIVVIAVLSILVSLVLDTLGGFYQWNTTSIGQTVQSTDTRGVLRSIESDITGASGFTTTLTAATPLGSDNASASWNYTGNDSVNPTNRVLIANSYATDKPVSDATRQLLYVQSGGTCDPSTATPFQNYLVYFVKKDPITNLYNLYRRTMIGSGTPCPTTPFQKQSCAGSVYDAYTSVCKATDTVLLYDVSGFTVDYYASTIDQNPINAYGSPAGDITHAKAIVVTVTTSRKINGVTTPYSSSIRISRLN